MDLLRDPPRENLRDVHIIILPESTWICIITLSEPGRYVMDLDQKKAPELRQVIAATVASDPTKYSKRFLVNQMKSIVLGFLTQRSGEEKYSERVMLINDGLHYDALAMSPFEGAPEEFDRTIFAVQNGSIGPEGGCRACTGNRACQLSRIQITES